MIAWAKSRPTAGSEHMLLSLPRSAPPRPLGTCDIARIVDRHASSRGPARRPALTAHAARHRLHAPHGRRRRPRRDPRSRRGTPNSRTTTIYTVESR